MYSFETYFEQPLQRILKPFFFASVGFSVPITRMFTGAIIWRGFVYTILMFVTKFACGFWLMRLPALASSTPRNMTSIKSKATPGQTNKKKTPPMTGGADVGPSQQQALTVDSLRQDTSTNPEKHQPRRRRSTKTPAPVEPTEPSTLKPVSLYPGCIVGCAMVARGEIGFLISALAESNGIFGAESDNSIFLIVTWAIMLCTIIGPFSVGLLVTRVKKMEAQVTGGPRAGRALGEWGFS
jgi:hypothetical protein